MKNQPVEPAAMPPASPAPNSFVDMATVELLASWRAEDATDNPEEIRAAEQDLAEFKRAINESRTKAGALLLYP